MVKNAKPVKISVKHLASPVKRSGSIQLGSMLALPELGSQLHIAWQDQLKKKHANFEAEFPVSHKLQGKKFSFQVSGRIDGLLTGEKPVILELKTGFNIFSLKQKILESYEHPYALQARIYAYFYYLKTGFAAKCQMILHEVNSERELTLDLDFEVSKFEAWLQEKVAALEGEEERRLKRIKRRKALAARLVFPYPQNRSEQTRFVKFVEEACEHQAITMAQAPTGTGKTIASLFPLLKDALTRGSQLIYLTPKNSQFTVVLSTIKAMQKKTKNLKILVLSAKEKSCLNETVHCDASACSFAKDYFDKFETLDLRQKIDKRHTYTSEYFKSLGLEQNLCPYQLSLDALAESDIIVCDYNYVFSPHALFNKEFLNNSNRQLKPNLVIDEAHNLPDRAVEYYSPEISGAEPESPLFASSTDVAHQALQDYNTEKFKFLTEQMHSNRKTLDLRQLENLVDILLAKILESSSEHQQLGVSHPVVAEYISMANFHAVASVMGEESQLLVRQQGKAISLKIVCCSAAKFLQPIYKLYQTISLHSATLKPFDYFQTMLGLPPERTQSLELFSPFPPENRKILIIPQISTTYQNRQQNYARIADCIQRLVFCRSGSYIAFFPSYSFLYAVRDLLNHDDLAIEILDRSAGRTTLNHIIDRIKTASGFYLVLAVQGGSLAEGVDIIGDSFRGVFVVGPGLPAVSPEREVARKYFSETYGQGFEYAYVYPAMTKSIQAAGRIIRAVDKRGLIVLLDRRFVHPTYAQVMPKDWFQESPDELVSKGIMGDIDRFWTDSTKSIPSQETSS